MATPTIALQPVEEQSLEAPTKIIGEERVVLHNISWETFDRLIVESGDHRNTRFYYVKPPVLPRSLWWVLQGFVLQSVVVQL